MFLCFLVVIAIQFMFDLVSNLNYILFIPYAEQAKHYIKTPI